MALRNLVIEGDPLLRKTSRPVDEITPRIIKLLDDMADTMYFEGRGIGIAAPQVGVLRRIFVIDVGDEHGLIEFINPEIIETSGSQIDNEGCLSVPGKCGTVERPDKVWIEYQNRYGEKQQAKLTGFEAKCFCHEYDHLDGILYIDKATEMFNDRDEYAQKKDSKK